MFLDFPNLWGLALSVQDYFDNFPTFPQSYTAIVSRGGEDGSCDVPT